MKKRKQKDCVLLSDTTMVSKMVHQFPGQDWYLCISLPNALVFNHDEQNVCAASTMATSVFTHMVHMWCILWSCGNAVVCVFTNINGFQHIDEEYCRKSSSYTCCKYISLLKPKLPCPQTISQTN